MQTSFYSDAACCLCVQSLSSLVSSICFMCCLADSLAQFDFLLLSFVPLSQIYSFWLPCILNLTYKFITIYFVLYIIFNWLSAPPTTGITDCVSESCMLITWIITTCMSFEEVVDSETELCYVAKASLDHAATQPRLVICLPQPAKCCREEKFKGGVTNCSGKLVCIPHHWPSAQLPKS